MAEESPDTAVRSKPILERHLQTILLGLVMGLISWQGWTTQRLIEASARQDERIIYLTQQVTEVNRELREQRERYVTRSEFERRDSEQQLEINSIRDRVRTLEER